MLQTAPQILAPDELPATEVINPAGPGPVVLVCEHASARIPAALDGLGLRPEDRQSHAAWDPGALDLARAMSEQLQAPLVASRVSRLVYDCNRPPEAASATPARSEVVEVPGNRDLTADQHAARVTEVYQPFRDALARVLDRHGGAVVTIHSFTPLWHGQQRATEIGLLHDRDSRLANAMMAEWNGPLTAALNAPYSASDGVTHTLALHALPRQRLNVMIEVRNDLLTTPEAIARVADQLCAVLSRSLGQFGTRSTACCQDGPATGGTP
ncbi:N-formylglutamate amidohydrolase [Pseudooceanicola algae]|uniref:Uncharacterized protein n=1 Tax=Pseudooceanicola algae TaxID=1537215 RepID=A0A418SIC5_9RHOB|nr:N-formylglutamate amidohydrolase [Pseudooceanicola algae]QPM92154.1 hypothetical protein PSAL_034170 [Pseudooceanicola algae]